MEMCTRGRCLMGMMLFVRISKSHIINASYIKNYFKGEPFIIQMTNDETFEVARRKKPEVLMKLKINWQ